MFTSQAVGLTALYTVPLFFLKPVWIRLTYVCISTFIALYLTPEKTAPYGLQFDVMTCVSAFLRTVLLFSGPVLESLVLPTGRKSYSWDNRLKVLVLGPLTEEFVFRLAFQRISASLYDQALFGMAHICHHLGTLKHQGLATFAVSALFQVTYTTLFGLYATFEMERSGGSVWPAVFVHAVCNYFGVPAFRWLNNRTAKRTEKYLVVAAYVFGVIAWAFVTFVKHK